MTPQEALQQLVAAYPDWRWHVDTSLLAGYGFDTPPTYSIAGFAKGATGKTTIFVSVRDDLPAAVAEALRQACAADWNPYADEAA